MSESPEMTRDQVIARIDAYCADRDNSAWENERFRIVLGVNHEPQPGEHWTAANGTLQAIVRHVSRSGMLRVADLYAMVDGDLMLIRPPWFTTYKLHRSYDGYSMNGAGYDVTFELAYAMFEQAKRLLGIEREEWRYQEHMPRVRAL